MSIYHCTIKIGSRAKGQSAVAAAAYRSGSKLTDKEVGQTSDYTRKGGVVFSEISLCKNAPNSYADRETLWNAVHKVEKQKNAQLWREIEVALPKEFDRETQIAVVREYVKPLVDSGMCADWSLHDKGDGNPHAHIMLTMRPIKANGEWGEKEKKAYALDEKGQKIPVIDKATGEQKIGARGRKMWQRVTVQANDWNDTSKAEEWRAAWAKCCNEHLDSDKHIDNRSYKRQGVDLEPTIHEGYAARKIASEGFISPVIEYNKGVTERNNKLKEIWQQLKEVAVQIQQLMQQLNQNKGSEFSGRISDLLSRRNRTASNAQRGITDGERAAARTDRTTSRDDTATIRRQTSITADLLRAARAANSDTATTLQQSTAKVESSTASRANRNAERERQAAESRRRDEEEHRRAAENERKRVETKRKSYLER